MKVCNILISAVLSLVVLSPTTINAEETNNQSQNDLSSYVVDEKGNVYAVEKNLIESKTDSNTGEKIDIYTYDFSFPDNNNSDDKDDETVPTRGEDTSTSADSSGSVRATISIRYYESGKNVLLTQVSGNWTIYDSSTYIISKNLSYGCVGPNPNTWWQRASLTPYTPFVYNTGFTTYVPNNFGSDVGANMTFTLQNGGTWIFYLDSFVVQSNLGLF